MTVLWYAIGIYMIGMAVVLYIRPQSMFRENGIWKEFGLATDAEQTIFPFWMFALVWAILSYALANLIHIFFASLALKSMDTATAAATATTMPTVAPNASFMQPISTHPNVMLPQIPTPPQVPTAAMSQRVPGYYILDPYANPMQPRYIYYGLEPPGITPTAGS